MDCLEMPWVELNEKCDIRSDEQLHNLIRKLKPSWELTKLVFEEFAEGTTNRVFSCGEPSTNYHDKIVVRMFRENSESIVLTRENEVANIKFLSVQGLAAPVLATFKNGFVTSFVYGVPLDPTMVKDKHIASSIAKTMAQMHSLILYDKKNMENGEEKPCIFTISESCFAKWPATFDTPERQEKFDKEYPGLAWLKEEYEYISKLILGHSSRIVLCHNDLLLKNVIYNEEADAVTFIDFEYTGPNFQSFDIGNHFSEFSGIDTSDLLANYPEKDFQMWWIQTYLGFWDQYNHEPQHSNQSMKVRAADLCKEANQCSAMAHFFWSIDAIIRAKFLRNIDFDFLQHAIDRMNAYKILKEKFLPKDE